MLHSSQGYPAGFADRLADLYVRNRDVSVRETDLPELPEVALTDWSDAQLDGVEAYFRNCY